MPDKNELTGRFGGPGSSHQEHGHMKDTSGGDAGGGHHDREHGRT